MTIDAQREPQSVTSHSATQIAPGLAYLRDRIVNVAFIASMDGRDDPWLLVDAGLAGSASRIIQAAEALFGSNSAPAAIVLTHGHFDHVGSLRELVRHWQVPVYAHELELPYLTGRSSYPPPDPAVGGGGMALMSRFFPRKPIDLGDAVQALPADGTVPAVDGWRWIHTPGHAPGHVSLFRDYDRALVAGDAFVTTKQESLSAALTQRPEIHGPPAYYTSDWRAAEQSVDELAALRPLVAVTGHGVAMRGERLQRDLDDLSQNFRERAVPAHGRYVKEPALADRSGVLFVPPPVSDPVGRTVAGVAAVAVAAIALSAVRRRSR
ncbi:MAG TPA: MBL fold metallo-hydrolase [Gemmatimonadaceae bacterium]|nr:MBL fold metallo-hydrolase [Gemmatimonadaceae bacterium]